MPPRFDELQPSPARHDARKHTERQPRVAALPGLLQLQRMAGNRAVLQALDESEPQREYPGRNTRVRPTDVPAQGPLEDPNLDLRESSAPAYTFIAVWLASRKYENALHKELVRHYAYGKGRTFPLPRAKMEQVIEPGHAYLRLFHPRFAALTSARRELTDQLTSAHGVRQGQTSPVTEVLTLTRDVDDRATVDCQHPTLGSFQCKINGTLTVRWIPNFRDFEIEFSGTMSWFDRWDFDPLVPDESAPHTPAGKLEGGRTEDAERGTRLAHTFLPGTAFDVVSETVPVRQKSTDVGAMY